MAVCTAEVVYNIVYFMLISTFSFVIQLASFIMIHVVYLMQIVDLQHLVIFKLITIKELYAMNQLWF